MSHFSDPTVLRCVQRNLLTRFLDDHKHCLPPDALALLNTRRLDHEQFCVGWAAKFRARAGFGADLIQAMNGIENLAQRQNAHLLEQVLACLPEGYEVSRDFPPLNQSLHVYIIARAHPEVPWPGPMDRSAGAPVDRALPPSAPVSDASLQDAVTPSLQSADESEPSPPNDQPSTTEEPEDKTIERLALLAPRDYDRTRKAEARRLFLRVSTLDKLVDECRDRLNEAEAAKVFLEEITPWPDPISDPPGLFDAVHNRYSTYAWLPRGAATVLSMFTGHCHAFPAFHYTPRINIRSDFENSGKTTTMKVVAALVPRPLPIHNLRPPVVYRVMNYKKDKPPPVVLFDEIENYLPLYRELLGLLNAGNSSDVCVPRCEGKNVHIYRPFAPVVLAGLGDLFRTLRSRSILIHMTEAPAEARLTRFDPEHLEIEKQIRRKLARWASDNLKKIAACDPQLPPGLRNRPKDNWRVLFQVAYVIGGHWPERVLEAYNELTAKSNGETEAENLKRALLADIRQVFAERGAEYLTTSDLVAALCSLPNRPWSEAAEGKQPIDPIWLARQLRPFGIAPRNIRIGQGRRRKGYAKGGFMGISEKA